MGKRIEKLTTQMIVDFIRFRNHQLSYPTIPEVARHFNVSYSKAYNAVWGALADERIVLVGQRRKCVGCPKYRIQIDRANDNG